MEKSKKHQIKLTKELYQILSVTGNLDLNLLFEYCKLLLSCNVYSDRATDIITHLISKGVSCKSIGGLYDKALLVIHPNNSAKGICDKYINEKFNFLTIAE